MSAFFTSSSQSSCLLSSNFADQDQYSSAESPPDSVQNTRVFIAVANGIASPPTFLLNLLIIWTILEKERLRTKTYYLLLGALAFTDLLVGLVVEPLFVWYLICSLGNCHIQCLYSLVSIPVAIGASLTLSTLMMASVERYIAIEHCEFYRTKLTYKHIIVAITTLWLATPTTVLVSKIIANDSESLSKLPGLTTTSIAVLVILYCTAKVQISAYRHRKHIKAITPGILVTVESQYSTVYREGQGEESTEQRTVQKGRGQAPSQHEGQGEALPVQSTVQHEGQGQASSQQEGQGPSVQRTVQLEDQGRIEVVHPPQEHQQEQNEERKRKLRELKNALTTALLVLFLILSYLPLIITSIIETSHGKEFTADFKYLSQPISLLFINLQSVVNPILMSLLMSTIRKGVKNKICRICTMM